MKKKIIGIYKITSPNGRVYIGQSVDIDKRWIGYRNLRTENQILLHRSFLKYGVDKHKFEVIETCVVADLNTRERYWQDHYNVLKTGLNCLLTSTDELPKVYSKEVCQKISDSNKGKIITKEHREKLRIAFTGEKNHFYGKTHTQESKEKISKVHKGKKITGVALQNLIAARRRGSDHHMFGNTHSYEAKKQISEKKKGVLLSEEHKKKISEGLYKVSHKLSKDMRGDKNPMYGRKHSEESLIKMRQVQLGKKPSKETLAKMSLRAKGSSNARAKIVVDMNTGIFFDYAKECAEAYGYNYSTLKSWLNGSNKNPTSLRYV